MAEVTYGQSAADALDALLRPDSKMNRGLARRALDARFPKDRPLQLALPHPTTPDTLDAAMDAIHDAWTGGQISPAEALTCQRLVRNRYRAGLDHGAGRPL
jgi:hypothetical protein